LLVVSWDPAHSYQAPTLYNWNLAVERQLPSNVLVRAAYAGSHGSHLKETIAFNVSPVSTTGVGTPRLNAIVGSNVFATTNNGPTQDAQDINSSYHSLQLSAEKRMSHALTILGSYTWSKSIDDLPNGGGVADIGADTVSPRPWDDPLRHQFDRGPSDFDHTHRFVASYVWQLPSLSRENRLLRQVFGSWEFGGVVSAQTGRPFTILSGASGVNSSGTGIGQDRANLIGAPYGSGACVAAKITTKPCVDWLNPVSFQSNASGTFGNIGKGGIRLPGAFTWDMGLSKNFSFTERWKLQFRAEFFNALNRANFMDDSASLTNFQKLSSTNNFGAIQQAADPRIGQLALKLFF